MQEFASDTNSTESKAHEGIGVPFDDSRIFGVSKSHGWRDGETPARGGGVAGQSGGSATFTAGISSIRRRRSEYTRRESGSSHLECFLAGVYEVNKWASTQGVNSEWKDQIT